jgi:site-specific recombinase XerC
MLRLTFPANEEHAMTIHNSWTLDSLVDAYKRHQRRVRGLRERTLLGYEQLIRPFLQFSLGDDPLDPRRLRPTDVIQFVVSLRDRFSPRSMKHVRTALRSLFGGSRSPPQGGCDFLGHQCLDTTAIYAKLDLPALREVALPWPEVLS